MAVQRINDPVVARELGEIRAQLRELIHARNNSDMRDEFVAKSLAKLEDIPKRIEQFETRLEEKFDKIDRRLSTLEDDKIRREQTASLGVLLLKSPAIGWLVGLLSAAAIYIFGRSH